ncbi:MAG: DUF4886 domain-containing protein [Verrucomicrobia bacterium]|nr:DUF4886 domain-containing protein [Verrucomicrobiota bacterium]
MRHLAPFLRIALLLLLAVGLADARTLRLFSVGNSFSNNATHYLPDLAKEGGHELILGKAMKGGCSFQQHWDALAAWQANPDDPKGRIYTGSKSLHDNLGAEEWDVITVQQYSKLSSDVATYRPYAEQLVAHLRSVRPKAEVILHQTWAYRVDADKFGQIAPEQTAADNREMYVRSRAAYREIAAELGLRVIPTGDAFWQVNTDPAWAFKPDTTFDRATAVAPALPDQTHSLHVGERWTTDTKTAAKKLTKDANHANAAGEYLGALIWYGVLFEESPEKLKFVPPGVDAAFAAHLRKVAWQFAQESLREKGKVGRK